MRRLLAVAALLGGCTSPTTLAPCSVDQFVQAAAPQGMVEDCGTYNRGATNYTQAAMSNAQKDVLNAIVAKRSFRLIYDAVASDGDATSNLRAGWVGTVTRGVFSFETFAGNAAADMASSGDFVSSRSCTTINATDSCSPMPGIPCLDCTGMALGQVLCRN